MFPSAAIIIWPVPLETLPPSAMRTTPPFKPALVSAVMVIAPFTDTMSPNAPMTTSLSPLTMIIAVAPEVCTTPLIMVEALAGALLPSANVILPMANTWATTPSASINTLSTWPAVANRSEPVAITSPSASNCPAVVILAPPCPPTPDPGSMALFVSAETTILPPLPASTTALTITSRKAARVISPSVTMAESTIRSTEPP